MTMATLSSSCARRRNSRSTALVLSYEEGYMCPIIQPSTSYVIVVAACKERKQRREDVLEARVGKGMLVLAARALT